MTPNEQTAVEVIKHHLWTYRTGGLSRGTFLSFMEKEIALLEASPTVPVSRESGACWTCGKPITPLDTDAGTWKGHYCCQEHEKDFSPDYVAGKGLEVKHE